LLVLTLARPPLSGRVTSGVVPSENVTVPVGAPAVGFAASTVAVTVTACPNTGVEVLGTSVIEVPYRKEMIAVPLPCWILGTRATSVAVGAAYPLPPPPPAP
jgi:hypothetical protein